MILDRLVTRMQPVRLYSNGPTSTLLLLRDARYGVLRWASFAFCALAFVSLIDAANQSGGAAVNWLMGWLIAAGLCYVLAKQDLAAGRHATLYLRRPRSADDRAQFQLYIDHVQVAEGVTDWLQFRVYQVVAPRGSYLRASVTYWVVFVHPQANVAPYARTVTSAGVRADYLLIERCLHPEDAARLLQQLQVAVGVPADVSADERITPQLNWVVES